MAELTVVRIESPWARAGRSFFSAIAADPVLIAFAAVLASANIAAIRANLVPVVLSVIAALMVALISLLAGFSAVWQAKVQTPFAKAVVQFIEKLIVSLGVIEVASLNSAALFDVWDKFLGALGGAVVSGILTYAFNRAQSGKAATPAPQPGAAAGPLEPVVVRT
jgi:hypothetical protein